MVIFSISIRSAQNGWRNAQHRSAFSFGIPIPTWQVSFLVPARPYLCMGAGAYTRELSTPDTQVYRIPEYFKEAWKWVTSLQFFWASVTSLQHNLALFMVPLLHNVSTRRGWRVHPDADVNTIQGGWFFFRRVFLRPPSDFSVKQKQYHKMGGFLKNGGTPKWLG